MTFKITPLGGLGQIGANTISIKYQNEHFLIDAGILFPNDDLFDINYLIPDYSILQDDPPSKLLITHGHEDHIGAVNHIIRAFPNIEIYAPPLAARLMSYRMEADKLSAKVTTYRSKERIEFGPLTIIPLHLTHSIPQTHGIFVGDNKHDLSLFYASDFKSDSDPLFEDKNDYQFLNSLGSKYARRLLMADSTNVLKSGRSPIDRMIVPHFADLFSRNNKRIFVTLFSSNIHRLQLIFDEAHKSKRKVYPVGRSIINMISTAKDLNLLNDYGLTLPDKYPNLKAHNLVVLLSGPQGDFKGALKRFSEGEDSTFKPTESDILMMSSRSIPGNEKKISSIVNKLVEKGVEIITATDLDIHTTGHASKEDLKDLYHSFNPTHAVPVHGESLFLKRHEEFVNQNFSNVVTSLLFNFDELTFSIDNSSVQKGKELPPKLIHSNGHIIEREVISERRKVAQNGSIFISLNTESRPKSLHFEIHFLGMPNAAHDYKENIDYLIKHHLRDIKKDPNQGKEYLRVAIRRLMNEKLGIKPTTVIHLV